MGDRLRTLRSPAVAPPRAVKAVEHAMDLLVSLADAGGELGVSDVARRVGLSKAAVHGLLATLESRQLVTRDAASARYRLGWGLYELGSAVAQESNLVQVARPHLRALAEQMGETALLGVLDQGSVLYVDWAESTSGLRMVGAAGARSPLHATASGKFWLAHQDEGFKQRFLAEPLRAYTAKTVTEPDLLRRQLLETARRGYAACWQEHELGLCSIAGGVVDSRSRLVATVSLAGPAPRITRRNATGFADAIRACTRDIGRQLGHVEPVAITP